MVIAATMDAIIEAATRAVQAAEEAKKAADNDPKTPQALRMLNDKSLEEARAVLRSLTELTNQKQSLTELATLLGEGVKVVAEESLQEGMEYAGRTMRKAKSLIEDHFQVDEAFRMLGPLRQDSNLARDVHDWFNLVALLPVIALNLKNWSCSTILGCGHLLGVDGKYSVTNVWHGEVFLTFWMTTMAYFVVDILFVILLPECVRSPKVIIQHHLATIGYIFIPFFRREYGWLMGACMIVEINTWFLIARRSFNKRGDKMFTAGLPLRKSFRLLLVSSCFYVTWFVIRLGFYPYLLVVIVQEWLAETKRVGTPLNLIAITPVMQCVFIFLNIKWTIDLLRSKLKSKGPSKGL